MALFTPISASVFRSEDPLQVANVFKQYERYKLEVSSKQVEMPSLQSTPCTASVDRSLLKHLIFMGNFDDVTLDATIGSLTGENIKDYLLSLINNKGNKEDQVYDPVRLCEAMAGLKFPSNIVDPAARITAYCADISERLDAIGYWKFKAENPKHTIRLLLDLIRPSALTTAMKEWMTAGAALKKVKLFIIRLKKDAKSCQAFGQQVSARHPGGKIVDGGTETNCKDRKFPDRGSRNSDNFATKPGQGNNDEAVLTPFSPTSREGDYK